MELLQLAVVWDVDPVLVHLGSLSIRYYGLCWAVGILLGYWLLNVFAKQEGIPTRVIDKMALYSVLGVIIGARLGHCYFYEPSYFLPRPLEVLKIWDGGLSSHGGIIGVLIGMWILCRQEKVSMLWVMDHVAIPVALIATFIRLGNLFNSEIYGYATTLPWGFVFALNHETLSRHPTQLYEALSYFVGFLVMLAVYFKQPAIRQKRGLIFSILMVYMFIMRFLIEFIKEDQEAFEADMTLNMGQWLSVPFLIVGVFLLVWAIRRPAEPTIDWNRYSSRPKRPKKR